MLGLNLAQQSCHRYEVGGSYFSNKLIVDGVQSVKLDARSRYQLETAIGEFEPAIIINTVALTNVDICESDPDLAYTLNVKSARYAAISAKTLGAKLVHISTDQLFEGERANLTEEDSPCPINVYGRTKRQAEIVVLEEDPRALVLRTNFYGWGVQSRGSKS